MSRLISLPPVSHPLQQLTTSSLRDFTANSYTISANATSQIWSFQLPSYPCTILTSAECSVRRASSGGSFSGDIVLRRGSTEIAKSRFKFWTYAAHLSPSMTHEFYSSTGQVLYLAFRGYNTPGSSYVVSDISWHVTTKRVTQ